MKRLAISALLVTALASMPAAAQQYVCMESNVGDFCMRLFTGDAPRTVANFLNYVQRGDFDSSMIHRSARTGDGQPFVIQGGGYVLRDGNLLDYIDTDPPIANEFGRSNRRGTVAMAKRGNDPNSASSQWYVNLRDNSDNLDFINGGYTVFAEIVTGMEVMDAIANLPRANFIVSLQDPALGEVPVNTEFGATSVTPEQLVIVARAHALDNLPSPFHCSIDSIQDAVAELCGGTITLPVLIGGVAYSATLQVQAVTPALALTVDQSSLTVLETPPAELATFDGASRTLRIPSVRNGGNVFRDVVLDLTDQSSLRFTLTSFTKP